jgi:hypothetical protein
LSGKLIRSVKSPSILSKTIVERDECPVTFRPKFANGIEAETPNLAGSQNTIIPLVANITNK